MAVRYFHRILGIIPGSYQCLKCKHVFRWKLGWLPVRLICCPRCLSFRVIPVG